MTSPSEIQLLQFCCYSGGSCALVALFLLGRVYVANAGDCRACIYDPSNPALIPMSYDFTPESDRQRIQLIAFQRPELLRHPVTKEKLYNRHVLSRKVSLRPILNEKRLPKSNNFHLPGRSPYFAVLSFDMF